MDAMASEQTTETRLGAFSREDVLALSQRSSDPAWMREFRLAAWAAAEQLPWPSPKDEEWRRTDPAAFQLEGVRLDTDPRAGAVPSDVQDAIAAWDNPAGVLVQRNSRTVRATYDASAGAGVVFTDLHTALRERPDLVREHFMTTGVRPDETKFRALHGALWSAGTFLYVPDGVEITRPLLSLTWIDAERVAVFPHTVVVAGRGSRLTLITGTGSGAGEWPAFSDAVTEVIAHDGAQVRLVAFQEWGRHVVEVGIIRSVLARDATVNSLVVGLGGKVVKTNVESILAGPGATSEMLGLIFADGMQHVDFHTLQEHRAPHTLSDLLYKNAVKDRARSVFSGMIRVHYGAQKTNAFQANRNLILSEGAKADSIPNLEIMANDLRCTHGSATSRLNEEHLFYLMSRGLTRAEAVRMVVEGFFAELLDRVPLERLRGRLQQDIEARMVAG